MFDKLKKAFSKAAKGIGQKELTEKVLDDVLLDLQIALLESDVAEEVVDHLSAKLKEELLGLRLEKEQEATMIVQSKLQTAVAEIFARASRLDLIEKIRIKKETKTGPFVIVFLGINGTGKTTTVAKIANLLRKAGFSVVIAAGDTHRAGAIEQLEQHTNRLSLKIVKQRYGADPSSVGRDAYDHAKKNYVDVVLMDTAGRMQTSKNLMDEMGKIVRVVKPDVKLFIGDALAGNDTINQAREFFQHTNFDGAVLTKVDADAKGGAAISIVHITSRPVVYIGVGQGYDDIVPFDPDKFIGSLFGGIAQVSVENFKPMASESELAIEKHESEKAAELKGKEEEELLPLSKSSVRQSNPSVSIFAPTAEQNMETYAPKSVMHEPAPPKIEEQPKEKKKSRFGFFGKKRTNEDHRSREEDEDKKERKESREEKQSREEDRDENQNEESAKREEEEQHHRVDEQMQKEKSRQEEDQGQEKDKIIYLTDEDIEDLLK